MLVIVLTKSSWFLQGKLWVPRPTKN